MERRVSAIQHTQQQSAGHVRRHEERSPRNQLSRRSVICSEETDNTQSAHE